MHFDVVIFLECDFVLTARDSSHTFYYQFGTSMRSTKIRHDGCLKMTNAKNRNYTIEAKLKRFKCIKYEYSGKVFY